MSRNILMSGLMLTAILLQPNLNFASDSSNGAALKENTLIEQKREDTQSRAHKMMAHTNLAKFALRIRLPRQAMHHIEKARLLNAQLEADYPSHTINSKFTYGKVTYVRNQEVINHYVPVIDDVLLISDYEPIFNQLKRLPFKETSAGVVHVSLSMDLDKIKSALDAAAADIDKKEYNIAEEVLAAAFDGSVINETTIDEPVAAISENLALAKAFLNNKQYDKTRSTFRNIQARLGSISDTKLSEVEKGGINRLSQDFNQLQAELRGKDPTMTQSINDRIDEWRKTLRNWFG
ncbi:MAG TPA: hypothetical protein PKM20_10315 [Nitrosomonas sp.]|nr:hypothetical protein [Nitrosomonas sp.]HNP27123.1 hypothetical protein [Nitrosomonas sp.]